MAKTIKFNLICNGQQIRSIEELRENFSVEDVLAYYKRKMLYRWLSERGYTAEAERVNNIGSDSDAGIIRELIRVFEIESDKDKIEEAVSDFLYNENVKKLNKEITAIKETKDSFVAGYMPEFYRIIQDIVENADDVSVINSSLTNLVDHYAEIILPSLPFMVEIFAAHAPKAIFLMLTFDFFRRILSGESDPAADGSGSFEFIDGIEKRFKRENTDSGFSSYIDRVKYRIAKVVIPDTGYNAGYYRRVLGDLVKIESRNTDNYGLKVTDKKVMVIYLDYGDQIVETKSEEPTLFSAGEINGRFPILNGIRYYKNTSSGSVCYMEV